MISKPENSDTDSTEAEISGMEPKPDIDTGVVAASQLWREKFNKTKLTTQQTKPSSGLKGAFGANIPNRFQNAKPSNTSRKAKKGFRAG